MLVTNTFRHIGIGNGLCNGFIKDIVQDRQGFLWFATESGLCRFDGKSFKNFKEGNSNILSDELNALLYDEEDDSAENDVDDPAARGERDVNYAAFCRGADAQLAALRAKYSNNAEVQDSLANYEDVIETQPGDNP